MSYDLIFVLCFHSFLGYLIFLELRKKNKNVEQHHKKTHVFEPALGSRREPPSQTLSGNEIKGSIPFPDPLGILKPHKASGFGTTNEEENIS